MPAIRPLLPPSIRQPRGARGPTVRRLGVLVAAGALALAAAPAAQAGGDHGNVYKKRNLVSDIDGVARITDPNLVNPWGLAFGPATPAWVADNGTDVSTLYRGAIHRSIPVTLPLVVGIPDEPDVAHREGAVERPRRPARAAQAARRRGGIGNPAREL